MKEMTITSMFVPVTRPHRGERRRRERKQVTHSLQLVDNDTREIVGHLVDIGLGGFKLESKTPFPTNKHYQFTMRIPGEIADQPFITFIARSKWCSPTPLDPTVYSVGFELDHITPGRFEIYKRMIDQYGRTPYEEQLFKPFAKLIKNR